MSDDELKILTERVAKLERRVEASVANLDKAIIKLGRLVNDLEERVGNLDGEQPLDVEGGEVMTADERRELSAWADRVRREANRWAERAEAARPHEERALAPHLDAIAAKGRHVVNYVEALDD